MSNFKKIAKSSLLLISLSASNKMVGLVSTLILARLLTPEDYGIIAIATLAFGLVEVLSQTGSEQYIVTSSDLNTHKLNTAFTYNAALKTGIAVLFLSLSPLMAGFYNDSRLVEVFAIFAIMLAATGFENPKLYIMKKRQEYSDIVKMTVAAKLISVVAAIFTALMTQNYWALIAGQFAAYTLPIIGGYIIAPYKPSFDLSNIKSQYAFSGWLIPSSMLGYFRTQIDTILVSRIFDAAALGSYHVMKYLALMPSLHLIGPMTQPLLAQLSSIKDNKSYFSKMFNVSLIITIAITIPISHILHTHSNLIIEILLGKQWTDYSKFLSLFGVMITFIAIHNQANSCFLIHSDTKKTFIFEAFSSLLIGLVLVSFSFATPFDFAATKISIEILLTIAMSSFVYLKFMNLKIMLRFLFCLSLILASSQAASLASTHIVQMPKGIFELAIAIAAYSLTYAAIASLLIRAFKNTLDELDYIWAHAIGALTRFVGNTH